jgi:hypothetical protein
LNTRVWRYALATVGALTEGIAIALILASSLIRLGIILNTIGAVCIGWWLALLVPTRWRRLAVGYMVLLTVLAPLITYGLIRGGSN